MLQTTDLRYLDHILLVLQKHQVFEEGARERHLDFQSVAPS